MRFFNTAGPVNAAKHYTVPPLQRVINSGGRIEREYGLGRQRVALLVLWPLKPAKDEKPDWIRWQGPVQKAVVALKVLHKSLESTIFQGLNRPTDTCGTKEGHLVIFNRDAKVPWEDKIFRRTETYQGADIKVWGM